MNISYNKYFRYVLLLIACSLFSISYAKEPKVIVNSSQIKCVDYITGKVLSGVSVRLHNKSYSYVNTNETDNNGIISFPLLPNFRFYADLYLDGYQEVKNEVLLNGQSIQVIKLLPNGIKKKEEVKATVARISNNKIPTNNSHPDLQLKIIDMENDIPVPFASVRLHNLANSYYKASTTDADGLLGFESLPTYAFYVDVYILGYKKVKNVPIVKGQELNIIKLESDSYSLNTVEVVGQVDSIRLKGDTTLYNANRYKSDITDNANSLLKKIPGTEINKGKITVEGDKVSAITIDGKEYYKGNNKAALEQIPSDIIHQIEIIDHVSADDPTQQTKTINILTGKTNLISFGKIVDAYGSNNRYRVAGNYYLKSDNQRFTFIADANNINREDLLNGSLPALFEGDNTIKAAGVNYLFEGKKKTEIDLSINLNRVDRIQQQLSDQQLLFETDEAIPLSSSYNQKNITEKIGDYYFEIFQPLSKKLSFSFISDGNLQTYNLQGNLSDKQTINNNQIYELNTNTNTSNNKQSLNNEAIVRYKSKFNKEKNILKYDIKATTNYKLRFEEDKDSLSYIFYPSGSNAFSSFQIGNSKLPITTSKNEINYKQFWKDKYIVNYRLTNNFSKISNDINTLLYDNDFSTNPVIETNLTGNNDISKNIFKPKINVTKRVNKFRFTAGFSVGFLKVKSDFLFPDQEPYNKLYVSPLPSFSVSYKRNASTSINMWYTSNLSSPRFKELSPIINNDVPSQQYIGDITIQPENKHNLIIIFRNLKNKKTLTKYKLRSTLTKNYIGNSIIYSTNDTIVNGYLIYAGNRLSKPVNFGKSVEHNFTGRHEQNIQKWKYGVNYGFVNQKLPTMFNSIEGKTVINRFRAGLFGNFYPTKSLAVNLRSSGSYAYIKSISTTTTKSKVFNWNASSGISYLLPKGLLLEIESTTFQVIAFDVNSNEKVVSIVNLSAKQALFKKRKASIQVRLYDLFNQNSDITQSTEAFYYTQEQKSMLTRYILFVFALKF